MSNTDIWLQFPQQARINGAYSLRSAMLVDAPNRDTECFFQRANWVVPDSDAEPERVDLDTFTFALNSPLLTRINGIMWVSCQSDLTYEQTARVNG